MQRLLLLIILVVAFGMRDTRAAEALVVHEWGVWLRQPYKPIPFDVAQPYQEQTPFSTLGSPAALLNDLPAFVQKVDPNYTPKAVHDADFKKPVLHFYGPEGLKLKVSVGFASGRPSVFFPTAKVTEETRGARRPIVTDLAGLEWTGQLCAAVPKDLVKAPEKHWWNALRAVPGMYFQTDKDSERFLFYEGTARQTPFVKTMVEKDRVTLLNPHADPSGPVLVIVNDGQTLWWTQAELKGNDSVSLLKADLQKTPGDPEKLLEAARAQWRAFGMTKEEAAAIVECWKPDLTGRLGFLVVARLPEAVYAQMFPLKIEPKPAELKRVGVIFDTLPGEIERSGWLPALNAQLAREAKELSAEDFDTRTAAKNKLAAHGDLIAGFLEELKKSEDPEVRSAANALSEDLKPKANRGPQALETEILPER